MPLLKSSNVRLKQIAGLISQQDWLRQSIEAFVKDQDKWNINSEFQVKNTSKKVGLLFVNSDERSGLTQTHCKLDQTATSYIKS